MSIVKDTMSALCDSFADLERLQHEAKRDILADTRRALDEQADEIFRLDDENRALEMGLMDLAWGDAPSPEGWREKKACQRDGKWGVLFTLAGGTTVWGAGGILFAEPQKAGT